MMRKTKGPGLSKERLVETALRLLGEVGLDGVTVRRIAAELGVQSPALYWHIRTKQELIDGMADAIVRSSGLGPPAAGESWQDWLARRARHYRRSLLAHRDGARVVGGAAWLGPETLSSFEQELVAMVDRGFTPAQALRTIWALSQYVVGFVLQEQAPRRHSEGPPASPGAVADRLGGAYPTLIEAIRDGGGSSEEAFEHGLSALIAGTNPGPSAG